MLVLNSPIICVANSTKYIVSVFSLSLFTSNSHECGILQIITDVFISSQCNQILHFGFLFENTLCLCNIYKSVHLTTAHLQIHKMLMAMASKSWH